ncbi:MAG: hypothetical protein CUN49_13135 [Candidatus Thermofonsia Clade 1 bacterium]|jgi:phage terminase large subunit-like protein|uniref:Terminase large subunit-like endonuclease domain-containing protein n=1 Tax=Candidatus Thermofonsia Clade 1 bacterium TaxID=2364210 RepID=A0A2M8PBM4_9CHLR|nr:MAG: hypothetical protein CUN49_13135 [Candidatus Thermofonsia Clade 1 bacterium]RMF52121.1 MAG: hypothetical protein D6749_05850 [Chloroflexota bacterium]
MRRSRPSFLRWAESRGGMYLPDHKPPRRATWSAFQRPILEHLFPEGDSPLPYSRVVWSCPKKSAKSTLAAALHLWFALFVEPNGEQYVLANDLEGSRNRVFRYILRALEQNPILRRGLDWQATQSAIRFSNGTLIRAVPNDVRGEAGGNQTFATFDEAWGVIHERSVRFATEFSPVPTRRNSLIFYTGYQGWANSTWWHALIDEGLRGEPVPELRHLQNGDGEPACWRNGNLFVYYDHVPRMAWHTPAYLAEQRRLLPEAEYLRVWENRRAQSADALCTAAHWDALYEPALMPLGADDSRPIVFGADAGTHHDSTALVGCTWNAERQWIEVLYCRVWQPEGQLPLNLSETLGAELARLTQTCRVAAVYYDPYQMVAVAEQAARLGAPMMPFGQGAPRLLSDAHLRTLLSEGRLRHTGDPSLRAHVLNAALQHTERGSRLVKNSGRIDAAVALSMAALGAVRLLGGAAARVVKNPFYE